MRGDLCEFRHIEAEAEKIRAETVWVPDDDPLGGPYSDVWFRGDSPDGLRGWRCIIGENTEEDDCSHAVDQAEEDDEIVAANAAWKRVTANSIEELRERIGLA